MPEGHGSLYMYKLNKGTCTRTHIHVHDVVHVYVHVHVFTILWWVFHGSWLSEMSSLIEFRIFNNWR